MSARVQEDATGKLDLVFEDLGEQTLKNIARPLRAYRVATGAVSATAQDTLAFPLPEFTAVRASRGKSVRAEPVAALYDQGRDHIGIFPQLEDQMANFTSDIDRAAAGYSPDRVDALVWAFSELLVEPMPVPPARRSRRATQQATTCSNRAPAWLDGVVQGTEEQGLNPSGGIVYSPADTPAMPGMLRKSTAFVPRYQ